MEKSEWKFKRQPKLERLQMLIRQLGGKTSGSLRIVRLQCTKSKQPKLERLQMLIRELIIYDHEQSNRNFIKF